jgi:hypothetical protein
LFVPFEIPSPKSWHSNNALGFVGKPLLSTDALLWFLRLIEYLTLLSKNKNKIKSILLSLLLFLYED